MSDIISILYLKNILIKLNFTSTWIRIKNKIFKDHKLFLN